MFTCLLENEIYQLQQKHTVNFESFRSIFNQPVVMSSGCPGSQLEVLYSQIKVAIFQPCERRARPQMETSFSGGLYWSWSSQWVVEHWNCGVTRLWTVCKSASYLISISNLWLVSCVRNSWKIYQDPLGLIVPCLVWINFWHVKEPWGSLTVLIHFHLNEPVMVNRRKTPGVAGGFYGWMHIHQTDQVKDVKCKILRRHAVCFLVVKGLQASNLKPLEDSDV